MRHALIALSTATICSLAVATPALAQTYPAPPQVNPPPANGNNYNSGPPVIGSLVALGTAPFGAVGATPVAGQPLRRCGLLHDFNGRYTAVCGP